MKSKEEILKNYLIEVKKTGEHIYNSGVKYAMEEYANQEAIEFAKWYFDTDWGLTEDEEEPGHYLNIDTEEKMTLDEIYSLYQTQKEK